MIIISLVFLRGLSDDTATLPLLQMWYLLDEFGSRFRQCAERGDANAAFAPFYYHDTKTMYEVRAVVCDDALPRLCD